MGQRAGGGDPLDRLAALEARQADLEQEVRSLRLLLQSSKRWPAAGQTTEAIAAGEVGEVRLVNQYSGESGQLVKAKNPYETDLTEGLFVTLDVIDGILLIRTADCP